MNTDRFPEPPNPQVLRLQRRVHYLERVMGQLVRRMVLVAESLPSLEGELHAAFERIAELEEETLELAAERDRLRRELAVYDDYFPTPQVSVSE